MQWFYFKSSRWSTHLLFAVMAISIFILSLFFVKTHDDYTLTEQLGVLDLASSSLNFGNGRYIGNFLVGLLLNWGWLDKLVRTIVYCAIVLFSALLTGGYKKRTLAISFLLYMGVSVPIFRQIFVWGHGFYNYTPPVAVLLCGLYFLKRFYDTANGQKSLLLCFVIASMGFCQQLFVENCTTINLLIAGAILVTVICKNTPHKEPVVVYFMSSLLGAAVMFMLPTLMGVSYKMNSYRGMNGLSEHLLNAVGNAIQILNDLSSQVIVWALFSFVLILVLKERKYTNKARTFLSKIFLIIYPVLSLVQNFHSSLALKLLIDAVFMVYSALLVILICRMFDKKERIHHLFLLGVIVLSALQLLIVKPCGSRCLFLPYVLIVILLLSVGKKIFIVNEKTVVRITFKIISLMCVAVYGVLMFVHVNNSVVDSYRQTYAKEQLKQGKTEIEIIKLPYEKWVHYGNESYAYGYTFNQGNRDEMSFTYIDYEDYLKTYKNNE